MMIGERPVRNTCIRYARRTFYAIQLCVCALLCTARAYAQDIEELDNSRGFWLRGKGAEAFVAIEPHFRVTALRRPSTPSMMADSTSVEKGLRLAFMGPNQIPASFNVGNQPATIEQQSPSSATVRLAPADGLRYSAVISFDAELPRLVLTYELTNLGKEPCKIACWSVISLAGEGTIVAPFGTEPKARRRIVLPWWTAWPQPSYRFERDALAVDVSAPPVRNCKVGVITEAGWVAVRTGNQLLVSSVAFDNKTVYPEDGANITIFQTGQKPKVRCEIEQVGPLRDVLPQQSVRMVETLDLFELSEPMPADRSPDALRKQIETARQTRQEPKQD